MTHQTFQYTHNRHRTHAEILTNEESPEVRKVRHIKAQTQLKTQLSGFDLISWNQHSQYQPNQIMRKIKLENDLAMHRVANEKVRVMPKQAKRRGKISANLLDSRAYTEHIKQINQHQNIHFLTKEDQQLLNLTNTPSVRTQFKMRYPTLWETIDKSLKKIHPNFKSRVRTQKLLIGNSLETDFYFRSQQPTKDQQKNKINLRKQKIPRLDYFATRKETVNRRMQEIIKNWKKQKKSVNQRYYDIWVKPLKQIKKIHSVTQPLKQKKHTESRLFQSQILEQSTQI